MDKLLKYFRDVQGVLQQQRHEEGSGDSEIILQNAFTEIDGYEFRLACHHDGSIILEQLLAGTSSHQLAVFLDRLKTGGVYERLLTHRYGSHVIETGVVQFISKGDNESETFDSASILKEFFTHVAANEDIPYDTFGSKVLRKVYLALAASSLLCKNELIELITGSILGFDISSMSRDACGTLYLQDCIQAFDEKFADEIIIKLSLYELCMDKNGSRIVESILIKTTSLKKLWKECFKGKAKELFQHRTANFVLQKLISAADAKILENILNELNDVENLWQHPGVLLKLCETRHIGLHKKIYKFVTKDLDEPVMAIATLKGKGYKPLGCQILSCLLQFDASCNKSLFDYFYDIVTSEQFVQMALEKHASRALQTLLSLIKSPQKFIKKATNSFPKLAIDPNGSHILELLFEKATMDDKQIIAYELKDKRKMVMEGSKYGSIVWNNLRMEEFVHNRERWLSFGEQQHKRKELFKDILEEDEISAKKQKK